MQVTPGLAGTGCQLPGLNFEMSDYCHAVFVFNR